MSVETARARFRRSERRLMDSTATVVRPTGEPVFDPGTGTTATPTTDIYGATNPTDVLIRTAAWEGSDTGVAQTEVRLRPWRLKFPHDAVQLKRNDVVTVISSDNAGLVGRVFRVTDYYGDDWAPNDPYFAEEVT